MAPASSGNNCGQQIGGDKKRTPAFALTYMNALVCATEVHALLIAREDHVPQSYRRRPTRDRHGPLEQPRDPRSVNLKHAAHNLNPSPTAQGQGHEK